MKKSIKHVLLLTILGLVAANICSAEWQLTIQADRDDNHPYVNIGVDKEISQIANAPEPPSFKCFIYVTDPSQNTEILKTDIRRNGEISYHWILAVNPHGDSGPMMTSANVSWSPEQLGPGTFVIKEGTDATGDIIVSNMKTQSHFMSETNNNKYLYYSIINQPDLSDLIGTLQILAGFPTELSVFKVDIDKDGQTDLSDSICMIRHLAMNP
jgi:hypothetical protein